MAERNIDWNMEEDLFICTICQEVLDEPKTLTCLHRFCKECLDKYIQSLDQGNECRQGGFQCPNCRQFIKSPNPETPPSEWASLLKTDFHLKKIICFVKSSSFSNPASQGLSPKTGVAETSVAPKTDHPCSVHKDKECEFFCVDCSSSVCSLCAVSSHRSCKSVLTLSEAANDSRAMAQYLLEGVSSKLKEASVLQKTKEVYYNKFDHETDFIIKLIRDQKLKVLKIVDKAEEMALTSLMKERKIVQSEYISKLDECGSQFEKARENYESFAEKLKSTSDNDLLSDKTLVERVEEMKASIDIKTFADLLKKFSNIKLHFITSESPEITMGRIQLSLEDPVPKKTFLDRFRFMKSKASQRSSLEISPGTLFLPVIWDSQPSCEIKQEKIDSSLNSPSKPTGSDTPSDTSCHEVSMRSSAVSVIQPSSNRKSLPKPPPLPPKRAVQVKTPENVNSIRNSGQVTVIRTIKGKVSQDDLVSELRDLIVVSPANTVIVTDWANQCVKAFYIRGDNPFRLKFKGRPWAITQLSDNMAAVSFPLSRQIYTLTLTPNIEVHDSFRPLKKYCGLAALSDSLLVASGGCYHQNVDIITLSGEIIRSFSTDANGDPLFLKPMYVSVTNSKTVLVSDQEQGAVSGLTDAGRLKFRYRPEGSRSLKEPRGIVSDSSGKVLVAESTSIISLTSQGEFHLPVVKPTDNVISDAKSLALDNEGCLYVISDDDTVKVLKG